MAVYSIIQKSKLESAHRLDAEYYQPEYLTIQQKLINYPHKTLEDVSESLVSFGAYSLTSIIEWREYGIPFITAENLKEGVIDYIRVRYIDEKVDEVLKKSRVQEGQILLSMSGSVGSAAPAIDVPNRLNSNQDIVKITPKAEYSPYVISAFLNSKYGQKQVLRLPVGSIQQHIFLWQLKTILVPKFPKSVSDEIEKIYKNGINELQNSKNFYSQAENLLLEELGLQNFESEDGLWNVVKLSEIKKVNRIDAEYFQSEWERLKNKIESKKIAKLGNLVDLQKGFEPGSEAYQNEGRLFIRVSSISKEGIIDKDQKYLPEDLYFKFKKDFEPKVGEILLTKDATPGIAYVLKEPIEGIISGGILRLKLKDDIEPEYFALCINSIIGQAQAERDAGGSVIAHWKPEQVKNLLIPILPKPIQQKIADLVQKSHKARKKAKELLEDAKSKVEEMIEE